MKVKVTIEVDERHVPALLQACDASGFSTVKVKSKKDKKKMVRLLFEGVCNGCVQKALDHYEPEKPAEEATASDPFTDEMENKWLTLIPAYGRDYQDRERLLADWETGKDFVIQDVSSPYNGRHTSVRDFADGKTILKIRYKKLTRFAVVKLVNGKWVALTDDESLDDKE